MANLQGMSPLKSGVRGDIPGWAFQSFCLAFESYVRIKQLNSRQGNITYKKLAAKINQVLKKDYRQKMLQRVLSATAQNLDALTMHIAEDRSVRLTTHSNIVSWFDNWEYDLVDLGFATKNNDGKVSIIPEQLCNIINFDETCLSLDGTEVRRGGRPEITLHDPRLPYNGKRSNKDSLTATLICGSNAAGVALPPHFQFQTKATTDEGHRLRNDVFRYSSRTFGFFGKTVKEGYDPTYGLNTKGGMEDCEFEKYVMQLIKRLYPNTLDRPGMRLILKCDSGPGRLLLELLVKLRFIGMYLYPCVPNTSAVTLETPHVWYVQEPIQAQS